MQPTPNSPQIFHCPERPPYKDDGSGAGSLCASNLRAPTESVTIFINTMISPPSPILVVPDLIAS